MDDQKRPQTDFPARPTCHCSLSGVFWYKNWSWLDIMMWGLCCRMALSWPKVRMKSRCVQCWHWSSLQLSRESVRIWRSWQFQACTAPEHSKTRAVPMWDPGGKLATAKIHHWLILLGDLGIIIFGYPQFYHWAAPMPEKLCPGAPSISQIFSAFPQTLFLTPCACIVFALYNYAYIYIFIYMIARTFTHTHIYIIIYLYRDINIHMYIWIYLIDIEVFTGPRTQLMHSSTRLTNDLGQTLLWDGPQSFSVYNWLENPYAYIRPTKIQ